MGFNSNDNLDLFKTMALRKPKVILELGTWLGQSAVYWLSLNPDAVLICVDHWNGLTHDAWLPENFPEEMVGENFPTLYETFLANVWEYRDRVIPIRSDTLNGIQIVQAMGITPDVVYVDADHEYKSVRDELTLLCDYFPKAILCGDDFSDQNFPGVRKAVMDAGLPHLVSNGRCWLSEPVAEAAMVLELPKAPRVPYRDDGPKKIIWTLNINDYAPEIRVLTRPLLEAYAYKIDAEIRDITSSMFPEWPTTYQKLAIYHLARKTNADWHLYIDSDVLIHPDMYDITEHLSVDTVAHNGRDMANTRWRYDDYFRRDGRNIGSCNWLAVAHRTCLDLWHPIEDLTPEQAMANIFPIVNELNYRDADGAPRCRAEHLIDDYALSRNIARFGLKFTTVVEMNQRLGFGSSGYFAHNYSLSSQQKETELRRVLTEWKIPHDMFSDQTQPELAYAR